MTARKRRERRQRVTPEAMIAPPGEPQNEPIYRKRPPGRPSLLTPEVEARFLDAVRAGNYISVAARYAGLNPYTVDGWIKRGRGHLINQGRQPTPETQRFAKLVDQARAHTEVLVIGNVVARSRQDHNAALAWLRGQPDTRARWFPSEQEGDDDFTESGVLVRRADQPAIPAQTQQQSIVNNQQIIVIAPEQADEIVGDLLAAARAERARRIEAQTPIVIDEEPVSATRVSRLDGLRADGVEALDTDDDD